MKLRLLALSAVFLSVTFSACKKDDTSENAYGDVNSSSEMKVPDGFDYSTTKNIAFDFSTSDLWGKEKIRLDIYDFLPTAGGDMLLTEFLDGNGQVSGNLTIPADLKKVYAILTTPDGSSVLKVLNVSGSTLSHDFSQRTKSAKKSAPASPDCSSGCNTSYNNNTQNRAINSGGVYCFTGGIAGSISVNTSGVTIRLCGNGNLSQISLGHGAKLEIVDGATVTVGKLNMYTSADQTIIYPSGSLTVNTSFGISGSLLNYGTFAAGADMDLYNGGGEFVNNGMASIQGTLKNSNKLENNASLDISGNFEVYNGSENENACKITVGGNLNLSATLELANAFTSVGGTINLYNGGTINLANASYLKTQNLVSSGVINAAGSTSLFKVEANTTMYNGSSVHGAVEFCDPTGIETNMGSFTGGASEACGLYIPTNVCFPEGNATPQIVDSDNDGVADNSDLYPNDPTASGAVYYPSDSTYATLAIEDLWPNKGDYDFNDLVVRYRHTLVTNSINKVVRVESDFRVVAIGGSFNKGLGFQFDLSPSDIESVNGQFITGTTAQLAANGTEQNQTKATIIVFDNVFKTIPDIGGTSSVNTVPSEATKQVGNVSTVVNLSSPKDIQQLGDAPFNPFVYIRNDRGKEIHLIDQAPTDLADHSYFGMGEDDSNAGSGRYYRTENNLPWALNIVGGDFDYPIEKVDIVEAYHHFDIWAQSGGTTKLDWYLDFPGHRDASKIY